MTNEIKTETENIELKRKPGRPKKEQVAMEQPIKRVSVTGESIGDDVWAVENKDPNKHYVWGRNTDDMEMNTFAQRGYSPATGNEKFLQNPFEAAQNTDGKTKIRGGRILMCCPKNLVNARRQANASRYVDAKKAGSADARRMMADKKGFMVTSESEQSTKRESLGEV